MARGLCAAFNKRMGSYRFGNGLAAGLRYVALKGEQRELHTLDAALRTALANSEYTDHVLPQGAVIFDEAGENINSAGVLIQIQDGKQVIVYPKEYAENEIIDEEGK